MTDDPLRQRGDSSIFEASVAATLRALGYRVRVGPRGLHGTFLRPDMAVDLEDVGTVLIETKSAVSPRDVHTVREQLRGILRTYPSAVAGFVVTSEPPQANWPAEIVSIADLPARLAGVVADHMHRGDTNSTPLTPGTVEVTLNLPFTSFTTTLDLPVVSASALLTATLAAAMVGSAVVFLAVTGMLATSWQAIVAIVAAVAFVTTGIALLMQFAPTSRLVWGVVGGFQRIGRDLAVATIASAVGTVVGTLMTLVLTGTWP